MDLTDESLSNSVSSNVEAPAPNDFIVSAPPAVAAVSIDEPETADPETVATEAALPEDVPPPTEATESAVETSKTESAGIRLIVSALSDIGCVRTNNEDSFGYSDANGLYVVCDGMGGMASGEVASASAVSTALHTYAAANPATPASSRLLEAVTAANQIVWHHGQSGEHKGMGTTLVAAALDGDTLIIGNVGDSRAYVLNYGQCMQLTVDHSYVNELIRNGTLSVENAHTADLNGMQNVITRAIGAKDEVQPDFFAVDMHPGTSVLLATDGLTRYLLQDEIALVLINSPFEMACFNLIELAKERGGHDNITCLLLLAQ